MKTLSILSVFVLAVTTGILAGCIDSSELDNELRMLISTHGLTGNPVVDPDKQVTDLSSDKVQLGKLLFFSKHLSGSGDVSCATCHHPFLGGDDDLPLSIGVDAANEDKLGDKRAMSVGIVLVPRNAPTTFNSSLWKKSLFHDGRVERLNDLDEESAQISTPDEKFGDVDLHATDLLQAQAGFPVTSEHEMRSNYLETSSNEQLRLNLQKKMVQAVKQSSLGDKGEFSWEFLFRRAYSDEQSSIEELVTFARIRELLAEYQRSQIFIDTPWKQYIEGDSSALNRSAKRGAILFYKSIEQGGAGCVSCHSGDFFTDEGFHNIAMPQIGFGKELNGNDRGRYLRTGVLEDQYAFRTPSLVNVSATAPYGHAGAYFELETVVKHHLSPESELEKFNFDDPKFTRQGVLMDSSHKWTMRSLDKYKHNQKEPKLKAALKESDIDDIVEFLEHLTDPCIQRKSCLAGWVPSSETAQLPDDSILQIK